MVLVPFEGPLGLPNPQNPDSPLNRWNWTLSSEDPDAQERLIQLVQLVDANTLPVLLDEIPQLVVAPVPSFLVSFDGPLTSGALYTITLHLPAYGVAVCSCSDFLAVEISPTAIHEDARDDDGFLADVANPQTPLDAQQLPVVLGTYQVSPQGDFALDRGVASLRKRIYRRILTSTGDFFHLVDYGTRLQLKSTFKVDTAQVLQARIQAQIMREPEVASCTVQVYRVRNTPDVLVVLAKVATRNGDPLTLQVPISIP